MHRQQWSWKRRNRRTSFGTIPLLLHLRYFPHCNIYYVCISIYDAISAELWRHQSKKIRKEGDYVRCWQRSHRAHVAAEEGQHKKRTFAFSLFEFTNFRIFGILTSLTEITNDSRCRTRFLVGQAAPAHRRIYWWKKLYLRSQNTIRRKYVINYVMIM